MSEETVAGGAKVNQFREESGFKPLKVYVTSLAIEQGDEAKISSTDTRAYLSQMAS